MYFLVPILVQVIRLYNIYSTLLLSKFDTWSGNYRSTLLPIYDSFDEDAECNFKQVVLQPGSTHIARYFDRFPYYSWNLYSKEIGQLSLEDFHGNKFKVGNIGNGIAIKLILA